MKLPEPIHTVASAVYASWKKRGNEAPRQYLGASIIGKECERALWYDFRWAELPDFDGRMYRLFNRGHREEAVIFEELRAIGVEVHECQEDGSQWGICAIGGHFRGHLDAAVFGTQYAPKTWAVLECKTHNAKSFKELTDKGVQQSKPQHYAQMQVYMGQTGMDRAMYYAVCKDDDQIYTEWLHFDQAEYDRLMARAQRIITAEEPPMRLRNDSTYYVCKMCQYAGICHGNEAPLVNCRTCAHSTPSITETSYGGNWDCELTETACDLPVEIQRTGCESHRYIPILLANWADYEGTDDGANPRYTNKLTGKTFTNGEIESAEIRACADKRAIGDAGVNEMRNMFAARIAA